jgi:hypothetical protein
LVGAHGELGARRGQRLERSDGAREGTALGRDIRLVMHEKLGQHLIDVLGGAGAPQGFLDHHPRAEADRRADGLLRYRDVAAAGQRIVQGVGEIRRRVDQCTVEIEDDRCVSQIGERHFKSSFWLAR